MAWGQLQRSVGNLGREHVIHIASLCATLSPCDSLSISEYSGSCSVIAFYVIWPNLTYPSIHKILQPCIRPIFPIRTKLFPRHVMSHYVMPCILRHVTLSRCKLAVQYKVCNVWCFKCFQFSVQLDCVSIWIVLNLLLTPAQRCRIATPISKELSSGRQLNYYYTCPADNSVSVHIWMSAATIYAYWFL